MDSKVKKETKRGQKRECNREELKSIVNHVAVLSDAMNEVKRG